MYHIASVSWGKDSLATLLFLIGSGTYIAAKSGFMLVGVIMPYNIIEKGFVEQVESLAKQCRVAFEAKERARAVAAEDQQQTTII